jgi:hypothetical protein
MSGVRRGSWSFKDKCVPKLELGNENAMRALPGIFAGLTNQSSATYGNNPWSPPSRPKPLSL